MGIATNIDVTGNSKETYCGLKQLSMNLMAVPHSKIGLVNMTDVFVYTSLMGLCALWEQCFYSVQLPVFVDVQSRIVVFGMLNVLIAMRTWEKD